MLVKGWLPVEADKGGLTNGPEKRVVCVVCGVVRLMVETVCSIFCAPPRQQFVDSITSNVRGDAHHGSVLRHDAMQRSHIRLHLQMQRSVRGSFKCQLKRHRIRLGRCREDS